jgi:plastocyanin
MNVQKANKGYVTGLWLSVALVGLMLLVLLGLAPAVAGLDAATSRVAAPTCTTIIAGDITADTTWTITGSPYCVHVQTVYVNTGITLTVEPGVVVYFAPSTGLDVYGSLFSQGTMTRPITYTAESDDPQPGDWKNIRIEGDGQAHLAYCDVGYGGDYWGYGFQVFSSDVQVDHCRLHDSVANGVQIWGNWLSPILRDSQIDHNQGLGLHIEGEYLTPLLENLQLDHNTGAAIYESPFISGIYHAAPTYHNLTFSANGSDALNLEGGTLRHDRTLDGPTSFNGSPILLLGQGLNVEGGYTLTVTAGTTLQFVETHGELLVQNNGTIFAEGTAAQPVTFTSDSATPQPADWRRLYVAYGGRLRLAYCDLSYAGDTYWHALRIESSDVEVRHCRIHDNQGTAVDFWGSGGLTALLEDTQIDHNTGAAIVERPGGWEVYQAPTYRNLTLSDNGGGDALYFAGGLLRTHRTFDGPGSFNGRPIVVTNSSISIDGGYVMTVTPGTTLQFVNQDTGIYVGGSLIAEGAPGQPVIFTSDEATPQPGDWMGIQVYSSGLARLADCDLGYAGFYGHGIFTESSNFELKRCHVHHNQGDGVLFSYHTHPAPLENDAITDNTGNGLHLVDSGTRLEALHTTLARNDTGVYVDDGSTAVLTNTIVFSHTFGADVFDGELTMVNTLWDSNATNVHVEPGAYFGEIGHVDGPANFQADGYHITCNSAAVGMGFDLLEDDVDGQPRPQPLGSLPDLGADENSCGEIVGFVAHKFAYAPQWIVDLASLSGVLRQRYLIDFYYAESIPPPPSLDVVVTDTLPAGLNLTSQSSFPATSFQQQGQGISWLTQNPLQPGELGLIGIQGEYAGLLPGAVATNTARVTAGSYHFDLAAITTIPLYPPLLVSPGDGETCYGKFPVRGVAQPGTTVKLLVDGVEITQTTASAAGAFMIAYHYDNVMTETLATRACSGADCSADSNTFTLTPQQSFWCPRESTLSINGFTYQFRGADGTFTSNDARLNLPRSQYRSATLEFSVGTYPLSAGRSLAVVNPPDLIWVETGDGVHYLPTGQYFPPDFSSIIYTFGISFPPGATQPVIAVHAMYGGQEMIAYLLLKLIDPDGYVFDVTQGFDPISPTLHAIAGVTVTAYVSMPEWGGWIPWPAQLYNDQVNPQVTGEDGYFAFFTPPGSYYLQVEGKGATDQRSGYQPWRSPVNEVISQVVHVNVPLTPWPEGNVYPVTLSPQGITPAVITVPVGSQVEWLSTLTGGDILRDLLRFSDNPLLRPRSDLDPLTDTRGWDGGMMVPGQSFRRQFTEAGVFSYTDGAGHTATVVVTGRRIYLPLVLHSYQP